jgi:hypothetical protein
MRQLCRVGQPRVRDTHLNAELLKRRDVIAIDAIRAVVGKRHRTIYVYVVVVTVDGGCWLYSEEKVLQIHLDGAIDALVSCNRRGRIRVVVSCRDGHYEVSVDKSLEGYSTETYTPRVGLSPKGDEGKQQPDDVVDIGTSAGRQVVLKRGGDLLVDGVVVDTGVLWFRSTYDTSLLAYIAG